MAAKQGLTAQLSQASEDAKRAVLSRTSALVPPWFNNVGDEVTSRRQYNHSTNLNTTCTIKSAPSRSPPVLNMLATKSGWLYKRNEQHVWQARWCCIVPHMFLYYFDAANVPTAEIGVAPSHTSNSTAIPSNPTSTQQDDWNHAVAAGYGDKPRHEKRGFAFFPTATSAATTPNDHNNSAQQQQLHSPLPPIPPETPLATTDDATTKPTPQQHSWQQPAGIIDLECYTTAARSSLNQNIWELAGDATTNPDLRPFYFAAVPDNSTATTDDTTAAAADWTNAMLHNRYGSLMDECDAYKQVCDGFSQQLQQLHSQLDRASVRQEEAAAELYRVRSHQEDVWRQCWRVTEEELLSSSTSSSSLAAVESSASSEPLTAAQTVLQQHLEWLRTQDVGVASLVQVLVEYARSLEQACRTETAARVRLARDLQATGQSDQRQVEELQAALASTTERYQAQLAQQKAETARQAALYAETQTKLQDVQKELSSTKLEMTMHGSQQRNKLATATQHKKILKKEVLDLRQKLDQAVSELKQVRHEADSRQLFAAQEQQKSQLLERYVEKMESQVKVQQNMMELMSASGSVYGAASNAVRVQ